MSASLTPLLALCHYRRRADTPRLEHYRALLSTDGRFEKKDLVDRLAAAPASLAAADGPRTRGSWR